MSIAAVSRPARKVVVAGGAAAACLLMSAVSILAAPKPVAFTGEAFSPCTGEVIQVSGSVLSFSPAGSNTRSVLVINALGTSETGTLYTVTSAAHATTSDDLIGANASTFTSQARIIATGEQTAADDFLQTFVFHFTVTPDGTVVTTVTAGDAICI
jgi:hypothetical protein